ncbi:MAG: tyrosine-type recombinase/integrase, partial [Candidatus Methanomethyliaceae archaeon]
NRVAYVVGKGGKSRFVFFTEDTAEVMRKLSDEVPSGPDDPVFWGAKRPLTVQALSRMLARLGKKGRACGPVNPHAWRHAFGRDMTRNGCPTLALQALMGHSTPAVTMIYARLNTGELQRVYDRYAAWEGGERR